MGKKFRSIYFEAMKGWVKIHRNILNWEWYDDVNTVRLFLHLILIANHKDNSYKGKHVKRGSLLSSRELLANQTSLSMSQVRTSLNKLKLTNEIAIKSSKQGTEIEIINYEKYQVIADNLPDNYQQDSHIIASNKKDKKEKNIFIPPTFDQINDYCNESNKQIDIDLFINFYASKGWMVGKNKMKDWKAAVRGWHSRNPKTQNIQKPKNLKDLYE